MGGSTSQPVAATLADLETADQRAVVKNVQLLAARNQSAPGKFYEADFKAVHAAMPPRLASALWRALQGDGAADLLGLNDVVRTIVPLRAQPVDAQAAYHAHMRAAFGADDAAAVATAYEDAAPWLASLGRASAGSTAATVAATSSRSAAGAARLLADASTSAWLVDLRELEPLPELSEGSTRLMSSAQVRFLSRQLTSEQRRRWRLLFTSSRDGSSFTRFAALAADRAPCLVVIRDTGGATFGGYAAAPLSASSQFGGSYGSFLFSLAPGAPTVHPASGDSPNLVYFNVGMESLPNGLAFGGNLDARYFGLWLRDDLETGRSDGPCAAYGRAPCLASSAEFRLDEVEVWAVEDDPPPPPAEEAAAARGENALTQAGVLSSGHEETRAFLAMAGRTQHAATLAPLPAEEPRQEQGVPTPAGESAAKGQQPTLW